MAGSVFLLTVTRPVRLCTPLHLHYGTCPLGWLFVFSSFRLCVLSLVSWLAKPLVSFVKSFFWHDKLLASSYAHHRDYFFEVVVVCWQVINVIHSLIVLLVRVLCTISPYSSTFHGQFLHFSFLCCFCLEYLALPAVHLIGALQYIPNRLQVWKVYPFFQLKVHPAKVGCHGQLALDVPLVTTRGLWLACIGVLFSRLAETELMNWGCWAVACGLVALPSSRSQMHGIRYCGSPLPSII
ncbi:uncharacterized protein BCR38DRAFT_235036 [Pseudomassariella vexata]|uniref:Uncharacterized protein n=1 Tax=Pseudomassariella vexata TaxID=1141098 RepID=A0A1Y2DSR8_9PEZI|nr:uncharacterized protein BCR38DRAFT_235036 [Pseudomassariella vexata]ORY62204.1 hypothetical protein BCR38DRAFT_235036 [Pseudomassariella vexata]